ncbi:MAG: SAM-dependent methyltransferase [Planctomycetota bacterium]|jgi:SAM-dependent methyltransferase
MTHPSLVRVCCLALLGLPLWSASALGQDFRQPPPKTRIQPTPETEQEPSRREYLGREVARTMHWRGAGWLIREGREKEERTELMVANLGLAEGLVVGDLGCGNGYLSERLSPLVGPSGKVLAADLQPQMLELLGKRMAEARIENVQPVLSTPFDPGYEAESCDLIVMVDVYHELDRPETVLAALRRALRPGGRLALVEFRAEDPAVPIKREHKMSKAQVLLELAYNGFRLESEFDGLPRQHLLFFQVQAGPYDRLDPLQRRRWAGEAYAAGAARAWLADDGLSLRGFVNPQTNGRGTWSAGLGTQFDPQTFGGQGWRLEHHTEVSFPGPDRLRLWCSAPAGDLVGRFVEGAPGVWRCASLGFMPLGDR